MTHDPGTDQAPAPVAAVLYDPRRPVDDLLVALAGRLKARGLRLGGLVQHNGATAGPFCAAMDVEDLATGRLIAISQDRGPGARGCRLDPRGLAEAGALAGAAIAGGVDLVIFNKFGKAEAEGRGVRAEFAQALTGGIPTLTSVGEAVLPAWNDFVGGAWESLDASLEALEGWCFAQVAARAPA
ncbi:DUF2478 domain-containing protein [Chelatococcus sp. SYSU_G07232]|uniref:DUF2478 domain-containing protein n=1 Tax=Chelatococcus albus TaxID=3047466 RepID=A0ABT7AJP9_9HYPH|nr:DUF2478 domain-containing protein [Chelatococcus sp. SYSU_G07232]MDJ1159605.1 DUF2478 domain-containing protein [Chelatococcus sp. SYSU_G07232]